MPFAILLMSCGTEPNFPENAPRCNLYWVSYRNGPPNIWIMKFPGGSPEQFTFFEEGAGRWGVDFSPVEVCYLGARTNNHWNIFRIDNFGANPVQLTDESQYDGNPTVSPDGERICFVTKRYYFSYYDRELAMMNSDGSELTRFTTWEGSDDSPIWSPDGSRIAFVREFEYGQYSIMIKGADSADTALKVTSEQNYAYDPIWAPDGNSIFCVMTVNGIRDIYKIPLDVGEPINITQSDWADECPSLSPDGEYIAHRIYRSGQWDLAITEIDRFETFFLTDDQNEDLSPCWSPDGSWVFWIRIIDGDREVVCTPVKGSGEIYRITKSPGDDIRIMCR